MSTTSIKSTTSIASTPDEPHNPDNLTPEQIGIAEGWRLLTKRENEYGPQLKEIEAWYEHSLGWSNIGYEGAHVNVTYRTKLTPEQLRTARGLPPICGLPESAGQPPAKAPQIQPATDTAQDMRLLCRIYNTGYHAGHHYTVESGYTDIHASDMENYHSEEVQEIVEDFVKNLRPSESAGPSKDTPSFTQNLSPEALLAEIHAMRGIIARNALQRMRDEDSVVMHVTSEDMRISIDILHEWEATNENPSRPFKLIAATNQ